MEGMPGHGQRGTSLSSKRQRQGGQQNAEEPPDNEKTMLSVTSCRMSRSRPAPRAVLTASSLRRARARASKRFARLLQAIRRRKGPRQPAPAATDAAARRSHPPHASTRRRCFRALLDTGASIAPAITSISALACSSETPGRSRADAIADNCHCDPQMRSEIETGPSSTSWSGKRNDGGMIPITTCGFPSKSTFRPEDSGVAPERPSATSRSSSTAVEARPPDRQRDRWSVRS